MTDTEVVMQGYNGLDPERDYCDLGKPALQTMG